MKILLIGNYQPDQQESMQRFANMLQVALIKLGHQVRLLRPEPFFGRVRLSINGLGKWLGYVDKFLLFPRQLRQAVSWADVVHICDHSNAMYTKYLQNVPHLVTCHDLLAVLGALGQETDCPASPTGKILQNWILNRLRQARMVACVSTYTKQELEKLAGKNVSTKNFSLVLNGLNYSYKVLTPDEATARLANLASLDVEKPFILHVGSSLQRKNRDGIIRIINRVREQWDGQMVFAGEPLTAELIQLIAQLNLNDRIIQIIKPDNSLLEALYNQAFALLFPSRFEGFGWPIIEAQACGCPVICSNQCSLPEVAGDAALIRPVDDEAGFAADILRLMNPLERELWVKKGLKNVERFNQKKMVLEYVKLYTHLSSNQ
jgi:glycosyltransferase involved in cell wall biosynthesis